MPLRNAKRLLRVKLRQKGISTLIDLAVGKSWSRLLDGQRRSQLSALPRMEGVGCFRIITGHVYLSELVVIDMGLDCASAHHLTGEIWMLPDSQSAIPYLHNWKLQE
ncbi:hypothetical protein TNCV_3507891 [Trichonephila clavipes]|uniref:Uncharacterized protein n=1 Tax=Trichonephila clavipes TaxID=2585209 RepID=A0A8X6RXH4_TRICX|nr:hypothetical protein TNCV_3507891 [Trichonephila clavipes]